MEIVIRDNNWKEKKVIFIDFKEVTRSIYFTKPCSLKYYKNSKRDRSLSNYFLYSSCIGIYILFLEQIFPVLWTTTTTLDNDCDSLKNIKINASSKIFFRTLFFETEKKEIIASWKGVGPSNHYIDVYRRVYKIYSQ